MKKTRKFVAGMVALESRTVLSSMHPTAHVIPFQGSGTLTTGGVMHVNGETVATVTLAGKLTGLGMSTGEFSVHAPTGGLEFTASGVITTADGDQINASFAGTNQMPKPHATKAVGHFQLHVTGGTGAFAHASGTAGITVTQVLATGKETFTVKGKIRE